MGYPRVHISKGSGCFYIYKFTIFCHPHILAPILVRNMPDFRICGTMREFSIPALFHRQIMRKFINLFKKLLQKVTHFKNFTTFLYHVLLQGRIQEKKSKNILCC